MDNSLNNLKKCKRLALSTNSIEKMISLEGMTNLEILSLGRNRIKNLAFLENIAGSLKELWVSYNRIKNLDNLTVCKNLEVLYISNNDLKGYEELDKLVSVLQLLPNYTAIYSNGFDDHKTSIQNELPMLRDILIIGNLRLYKDSDGAELDEAQVRIEVLKRLPNIKKINGKLVGPEEQELAKA